MKIYNNDYNYFGYMGFEELYKIQTGKKWNISVIIPIIRRVMPTTIANDIIGIQPMVSPQDIRIYNMDVSYDKE